MRRKPMGKYQKGPEWEKYIAPVKKISAEQAKATWVSAYESYLQKKEEEWHSELAAIAERDKYVHALYRKSVL